MAWFDWFFSEFSLSLYDVLQAAIISILFLLTLFMFDKYIGKRSRKQAQDLFQARNMALKRREELHIDRDLRRRWIDSSSEIMSNESIPTSFSNRAFLQLTRMRARVKQKDFLIGPRLFYYLDDSVVDSLYSQLEPEYKITHIETESQTETEGSIQAKLPILTPSYDKKNIEVKKRKMELIETSEIKYDLVLKYLFDNNRINLNVEDVNYNDFKENEFIENCKELEVKFNFTIPENVKNEFLKGNKNKLFEEELEKIGNITNYVMIKGEFITTKSGEVDWKLIYIHPLNEIRNSDIYQNDVSIEVICSQNKMNDIGKDSFSNAENISLSIFGNVINYDNIKLTLNIRPIAIH